MRNYPEYIIKQEAFALLAFTVTMEINMTVSQKTGTISISRSSYNILKHIPKSTLILP